jgi:hypothetical protein
VLGRAQAAALREAILGLDEVAEIGSLLRLAQPPARSAR